LASLEVLLTRGQIVLDSKPPRNPAWLTLIIGGVGAGALFIIPCMLMMGAMMWMMMGGAGGNSPGGRGAK
jgi:hypothetical protein